MHNIQGMCTWALKGANYLGPARKTKKTKSYHRQHNRPTAGCVLSLFMANENTVLTLSTALEVEGL